MLATDLDFSRSKNLNPYCAQMRSKGSRRRICPHRLAVPEKIFALLACSIFSTAAGAPPLAALGSAPPAPSPDAGEGDSIYNLYIKTRRRHLESVSAALYGRCFRIVRIQPQLKR